MPRRRRQPLLAAVGLVLVAGCAAISGSLVLGSDHKLAVLTLARPVAAGHVLTAADLGVAQVSGTWLHALRASGESTVIGQTATVSMPAGTLLLNGMFTDQPVPATGEQVVGVALKAGFAPVAQLRPGRHVSVISVSTGQGPAQEQAVTVDGPATGSAAGSAEFVLVPRARVLSVVSDPSSGASLVSLVVTDAQAPLVSRAAVRGAVSLALLPVAGGER